MLDGMTNIKANEVLKEIKYYTEDLPPYSPDEVAEALEMAIQALGQTEWIPVSERLPKDEQKVLVTTRSGKFIDVNTSIFYHASAYWEYYVIAWMPLPEPYKAESEK